MRNFAWGFLGLVLLLIYGSCKKDSGCGYSYQNITASASEQKAVKNYLDSMGTHTAVKDSSGFYYEILDDGSGSNKENEPPPPSGSKDPSLLTAAKKGHQSSSRRNRQRSGGGASLVDRRRQGCDSLSAVLSSLLVPVCKLPLELQLYIPRSCLPSASAIAEAACRLSNALQSPSSQT